MTDERLVSLLVLLDLSKAFDSVNHHLLCSKLSDQFGFTASAVSLIMSYLSDRSPVCADSRCLIGCSSHNVGCWAGLCSWHSAVHQWHRLPNYFMPCPSFCWRRDVQIYISYEPHHIENCIRNMNLDLDRIHLWSIENFLAKHWLTHLPSPIVSPFLLGPNHIALFVDMWHGQVLYTAQ
jgi:hypothetical protein